ncbi:MAG: membrane protein insertion efficiency factor YidD [Candidatus Buchananbacteria bacterium RIFCSPHIGHO2_02_FULL_45_11b]|uniref:Putative membrane protein insertion efficiency factor n=4 Tax=Candidatus Buchananiibacteriota TaxID=1817903 RepID=A0A1G1YEK6_9BACT|nr:MAG: membrane protein insertion efficiency factor YidD [Candidatus Buchananbacteria bacterium RIFCSPHIGHO2_01_FULL_46_12]OGY50772.1 MAG: membrane protein insertion efficiency factor YidD [Candidatus Buchananbacteria bacterium RIFCSPHIGHO2_02_FULL_45_11b]OGY53321.1 MAG: membrane protein insertion efficiency factor YidD [Candidatus Buchananbacteria bacterium RIFCSPLOWO2_01_FULL_45_31]OGY55768.1 MAG: membrane protein insertion efficiency factor YidD [Candidatus Buchananbacteria bacterium RIFCSPL
MRIFVLRLIKIYQKTLSFDYGIFRFMFPHGFCRFQPTCSDYGYQVIEKYGVIKGGLMAFWRVLRCNPWSKGGDDPVR